MDDEGGDIDDDDDDDEGGDDDGDDDNDDDDDDGDDGELQASNASMRQPLRGPPPVQAIAEDSRRSPPSATVVIAAGVVAVAGAVAVAVIVVAAIVAVEMIAIASSPGARESLGLRRRRFSNAPTAREVPMVSMDKAMSPDKCVRAMNA